MRSNYVLISSQNIEISYSNAFNQICKKKLGELSLIKLRGISVFYEVSAPNYEEEWRGVFST